MSSKLNVIQTLLSAAEGATLQKVFALPDEYPQSQVLSVIQSFLRLFKIHNYLKVNPNDLAQIYVQSQNPLIRNFVLLFYEVNALHVGSEQFIDLLRSAMRMIVTCQSKTQGIIVTRSIFQTYPSDTLPSTYSEWSDKCQIVQANALSFLTGGILSQTETTLILYTLKPAIIHSSLSSTTSVATDLRTAASPTKADSSQRGADRQTVEQKQQLVMDALTTVLLMMLQCEPNTIKELTKTNPIDSIKTIQRNAQKKQGYVQANLIQTGFLVLGTILSHSTVHLRRSQIMLPSLFIPFLQVILKTGLFGLSTEVAKLPKTYVTLKGSPLTPQFVPSPGLISQTLNTIRILSMRASLDMPVEQKKSFHLFLTSLIIEFIALLHSPVTTTPKTSSEQIRANLAVYASHLNGFQQTALDILSSLLTKHEVVSSSLYVPALTALTAEASSSSPLSAHAVECFSSVVRFSLNNEVALNLSSPSLPHLISLLLSAMAFASKSSVRLAALRLVFVILSVHPVELCQILLFFSLAVGASDCSDSVRSEASLLATRFLTTRYHVSTADTSQPTLKTSSAIVFIAQTVMTGNGLLFEDQSGRHWKVQLPPLNELGLDFLLDALRWMLRQDWCEGNMEMLKHSLDDSDISSITRDLFSVPTAFDGYFHLLHRAMFLHNDVRVVEQTQADPNSLYSAFIKAISSSTFSMTSPFTVSVFSSSNIPLPVDLTPNILLSLWDNAINPGQISLTFSPGESVLQLLPAHDPLISATTQSLEMKASAGFNELFASYRQQILLDVDHKLHRHLQLLVTESFFAGTQPFVSPLITLIHSNSVARSSQSLLNSASITIAHCLLIASADDSANLRPDVCWIAFEDLFLRQIQTTEKEDVTTLLDSILNSSDLTAFTKMNPHLVYPSGITAAMILSHTPPDQPLDPLPFTLISLYTRLMQTKTDVKALLPTTLLLRCGACDSLRRLLETNASVVPYLTRPLPSTPDKPNPLVAALIVSLSSTLQSQDEVIQSHSLALLKSFLLSDISQPTAFNHFTHLLIKIAPPIHSYVVLFEIGEILIFIALALSTTNDSISHLRTLFSPRSLFGDHSHSSVLTHSPLYTDTTRLSFTQHLRSTTPHLSSHPFAISTSTISTSLHSLVAACLQMASPDSPKQNQRAGLTFLLFLSRVAPQLASGFARLPSDPATLVIPSFPFDAVFLIFLNSLGKNDEELRELGLKGLEMLSECEQMGLGLSDGSKVSDKVIAALTSNSIRQERSQGLSNPSQARNSEVLRSKTLQALQQMAYVVTEFGSSELFFFLISLFPRSAVWDAGEPMGMSAPDSTSTVNDEDKWMCVDADDKAMQSKDGEKEETDKSGMVVETRGFGLGGWFSVGIGQRLNRIIQGTNSPSSLISHFFILRFDTNEHIQSACQLIWSTLSSRFVKNQLIPKLRSPEFIQTAPSTALLQHEETVALLTRNASKMLLLFYFLPITSQLVMSLSSPKHRMVESAAGGWISLLDSLTNLPTTLFNIAALFHSHQFLPAQSDADPLSAILVHSSLLSSLTSSLISVLASPPAGLPISAQSQLWVLLQKCGQVMDDLLVRREQTTRFSEGKADDNDPVWNGLFFLSLMTRIVEGLGLFESDAEREKRLKRREVHSDSSQMIRDEERVPNEVDENESDIPWREQEKRKEWNRLRRFDEKHRDSFSTSRFPFASTANMQFVHFDSFYRLPTSSHSDIVNQVAILLFCRFRIISLLSSLFAQRSANTIPIQLLVSAVRTILLTADLQPLKSEASPESLTSLLQSISGSNQADQSAIRQFQQTITNTLASQVRLNQTPEFQQVRTANTIPVGTVPVLAMNEIKHKMEFFDCSIPDLPFFVQRELCRHETLTGDQALSDLVTLCLHSLKHSSPPKSSSSRPEVELSSKVSSIYGSSASDSMRPGFIMKCSSDNAVSFVSGFITIFASLPSFKSFSKLLLSSLASYFFAIPTVAIQWANFPSSSHLPQSPQFSLLFPHPIQSQPMESTKPMETKGLLKGFVKLIRCSAEADVIRIVIYPLYVHALSTLHPIIISQVFVLTQAILSSLWTRGGASSTPNLYTPESDARLRRLLIQYILPLCAVISGGMEGCSAKECNLLSDDHEKESLTDPYDDDVSAAEVAGMKKEVSEEIVGNQKRTALFEKLREDGLDVMRSVVDAMLTSDEMDILLKQTFQIVSFLLEKTNLAQFRRWGARGLVSVLVGFAHSEAGSSQRSTTSSLTSTPTLGKSLEDEIEAPIVIPTLFPSLPPLQVMEWAAGSEKQGLQATSLLEFTHSISSLHSYTKHTTSTDLFSSLRSLSTRVSSSVLKPSLDSLFQNLIASITGRLFEGRVELLVAFLALIVSHSSDLPISSPSSSPPNSSLASAAHFVIAQCKRGSITESSLTMRECIVGLFDLSTLIRSSSSPSESTPLVQSFFTEAAAIALPLLGSKSIEEIRAIPPPTINRIFQLDTKVFPYVSDILTFLILMFPSSLISTPSLSFWTLDTIRVLVLVVTSCILALPKPTIGVPLLCFSHLLASCSTALQRLFVVGLRSLDADESFEPDAKIVMMLLKSCTDSLNTREYTLILASLEVTYTYLEYLRLKRGQMTDT
ncbi:hypothetical protein BLNAU_3526 [Blattamonas nauphoetae]|uniref:Uncharacterized protein n=1 Tax=Blattamonas nauphoetae TaxID=2049346 RepID=A0ABQ9YCB9_9EUKA|nr:hypothetical protein BLNAU_3526 [Blattamonas nauphoetae]